MQLTFILPLSCLALLLLQNGLAPSELLRGMKLNTVCPLFGNPRILIFLCSFKRSTCRSTGTTKVRTLIDDMQLNQLLNSILVIQCTLKTYRGMNSSHLHPNPQFYINSTEQGTIDRKCKHLVAIPTPFQLEEASFASSRPASQDAPETATSVQPKVHSTL
ncbi:hypothetical protein PoB_003054800 [Plakobranchus ocellatus]|uniref:Uncharacterized protein n=1 Tax=Plakobranchus ocellatus TaxID=259542 RepID=A0AAV4A9Z0_9GAST|nr:hypothetical protein PoB_003054800 [Plakobranchus ocellatus]